MQEPKIDNGRLNDVSAEGADGRSQLLQIKGTGNDADTEIDPEFLTARSALEQAWSDHAACDGTLLGRSGLADRERLRRVLDMTK